MMSLALPARRRHLSLLASPSLLHRPRWHRPFPDALLRSSSTQTTLPDNIYDVVCVGGGPAGLSLLAALRASPNTAGLKIALVEGQDLKNATLQQAKPSAFSNRCSSLTPASVGFLDQVGAWSLVDRSRVQPYSGMQVWDGMSGSRITFDWAESLPLGSAPQSSTVAYMIENLNLTTALQKLLTQLGGAKIISPATVERITTGPLSDSHDLTKWPTVHLSDGRSFTARLLVGADGANSPVRTFAGINARGWDYNRMGLVATLILADAPSKINAFQRFLPTGPVAMLPLPGNMASLVWSTTPDRAAALKSLKTEDFVAMVNAAFRLSAVDLTFLHGLKSGQKTEVEWRRKHAPVAGVLPGLVTEVQEGTVAAFPLRLRHADAYVGERIALIGDAAHTIHPLAGQGLNLGQGDVASLVKAIENAVLCGQDIGADISLESYNADRYDANALLMGVCDKLHKLYRIEAGPVVALRSAGLEAVNAMGFLKRLIMNQAAGGA